MVDGGEGDKEVETELKKELEENREKKDGLWSGVKKEIKELKTYIIVDYSATSNYLLKTYTPYIYLSPPSPPFHFFLLSSFSPLQIALTIPSPFQPHPQTLRLVVSHK